MRKFYQRRLPENPEEDYYYIIRETSPMQSLLVEYGFIDNPNDQKKLQDHLNDYVEGVVRAIAEYANVPYLPPMAINTYIVQRGDSLWSIANRFGITVDELRKTNNLMTDILTIGQVLVIPSKDSELPENGNIFYTVQPGDTLFSIANKYGISVDMIRNINNLTSDILSIGQQLIIPTSLNNPDDDFENELEKNTYIVQKGDSLWSIANRFGITVDELKSLNNLASNTLSIGQVLVISEKNLPNDSEENTQLSYTVKSGDKVFMGNNE